MLAGIMHEVRLIFYHKVFVLTAALTHRCHSTAKDLQSPSQVRTDYYPVFSIAILLISAIVDFKVINKPLLCPIHSSILVIMSIVSETA
jgi:hypothetical protein